LATRRTRGSYCPDAGELIWLSFDPQAGREQAGRRPALVLTPKQYNQAARLCLLCPITSQVKGYPFEVALPARGKVTGAVLVDHVKSLSWEARGAERIGQIDEASLAEVKAKHSALVGL
jgi:mRNA interferase MazF